MQMSNRLGRLLAGSGDANRVIISRLHDTNCFGRACGIMEAEFINSIDNELADLAERCTSLRGYL